MQKNQGFTLIELSIVLVIIGLVVGGILVGRDLISASEVRSQISQIDKIKQAVNTFYGKYAYLPCDIKEPAAAQFGFTSHSTSNGDGKLEGFDTGFNFGGTSQGMGENVLFWRDLSDAKLIDGSFNLAQALTPPGAISQAQLGKYFPEAKIGNGFYIYAWSGGYTMNSFYSPITNDGYNYLGIAKVQGVDGCGYFQGLPEIKPKDAYKIDVKIDDGLPMSGTVLALYLSVRDPYFPRGTHPTYTCCSGSGGGDVGPTTAAFSGGVTTCYDNNGVSGNPQQYSIGSSASNGNIPNCGLSFKLN